MAYTSNTCTQPLLQEFAPSTSTSAGSSIPAFVEYKPPTPKLAFERGKRYDVFLSFRGPDVRKTLVDHLFEALSAAGLNAFLDSHKLEKGELIGLTLKKAIEISSIHIPIFSEGYADSTWCLREAAEISSTSDLIIPLFYHVDPTHVRFPLNDRSPYKQSFLKHYGHSDQNPREDTAWWKRALQKIWLNFFGNPSRFKEKDIDGWKNALTQICERSGWTLDITNGFEAQLVKRVVNDLLKTLDKLTLEGASHPVGMNRVKDDLIRKLNVESTEEVVKVGIWGIGGIGKTAVATAVYNQVYSCFEAASFVFDVRTTATDPTGRGLMNLQKQILKALIRYNGEVNSVAEGKSLFKDRLGGKRVLLILDDVDALDQLEALVWDWLAPGSRMIITSRDKHILNCAQVSAECIQEMTTLQINEAVELFSWHAFHRASPSSDLEDLSKKIAEACKGHPLLLVVTGSSLFDKKDNKGYWTEALDNCKLNQNVHNRLKISYDPLNKEEKEIFVDIACFFTGEHKELPILFWKSFCTAVDTALRNLSMKALIKIDDGGLFHMHDLLQDMGRAIAENEEEGTRRWEAARLGTSSYNINLSRLRLNGVKRQRLDLLFKSCRLSYLDLQNLYIEDMTEDKLAMLPRSLIWLRLEHCHFTIEMNRKVKKQRHSRFEDTCQLKIVQLKGCSDMDSLFISSLFSLPNIQLQYLDLRGSESLISLPDTIGNLSQLQHLNLEGCLSLTNLPKTIGDLSKLQHLNLEGCLNLNNLPNTIGDLSQLQNLFLRRCRSLKYLPENIGQLSLLDDLDLEGCMNLENLPNTISNLSKLKRLNLVGCKKLKDLPDTIDSLSQLRYLMLRGCERLKLPRTIYNLPQLQYSF